ncbi:MAG: family 4 glycosyl hydrolase [Kiritimatiellia bacterium]
MAKIAMIGAASFIFGKTLMSDFLATPALRGSEYRLMARTHRRPDKMYPFVQRMIRDNGLDMRVTAPHGPSHRAKGGGLCGGDDPGRRQPVPLDPALAIANRFVKLAQA